MIFLKKHAMILIALIVAAVTMSFKLASNNEIKTLTATHWYVKNQSSEIYELKSAPPSECTEDITDDLCALGFNSPQSNVTDASLQSSVAQRYIDEQ